MTFQQGVNWEEELPKVLLLIKENKSLTEIAKIYSVTKQRVKQILQRNSIWHDYRVVNRKEKETKHLLRWGDKLQPFYQDKLRRYRGKKANAKQIGIEFSVPFHKIVWPEYCPVLNIKLDYDSVKGRGMVDNAASFDRINPLLGYTEDNTRIISMKANRIKNDATLQELELVLQYVKDNIPSEA